MAAIGEVGRYCSGESPLAWFRKKRVKLTPQPKRDVPDGVWVKCDGCGEIIYKKELARNLWVCSKCTHHFPISTHGYLEILLDPGTFEELHGDMRSDDPLKFKDRLKYSDRLKENVKKTGRNEAVEIGTGLLDGRNVCIAVMNFQFIGGSMGCVVGEKVARSIRVSLEKKIPLITVNRSGGARMMEGILSLMQMAKTSGYLALLAEAGIPYISIMTHPTTGGVTASYASLGDVIIAEPKALIGFAGQRVIKDTIGQDLPPGFQLSEFLLEHGMIDMIVHRSDLKDTISHLLTYLAPGGDEREIRD
jgi:acetyl-CoA carboxylase carboxyl transferase subunit beta